MSAIGAIAAIVLVGGLAWVILYYAQRAGWIKRSVALGLGLIVVLVCGVVFFYPSALILLTG